MIFPVSAKYRACPGALILFLCLPVFSWASARFIPPLPANTNKVEIYLLTRGAGADVYTKYGHTMIRVIDHANNLDLAYNWGEFDFDQPGFIVKFLRGLLLYHLDISPIDTEIRISHIEQRWLVQEQLNLTNKQKAVFLTALNREAQPDQRHYRYLFFTDNCATRPRDFIDKALGGKIAASFQAGKSGSTFRDKVLYYNASAPILAMGQDVILNGEVDRSISQWEEMFIPLKLREHLLSMPAYADDGSVRTGVRLLSGTTTLTSYPDPVNPLYNGYMILVLLLGTPLLLGMTLKFTPLNGIRKFSSLFRIAKMHEISCNYLTSCQKAGIRILGLALVLWGAVAGIFGLYLTLAWVFSEHTVVHHNANLWIFWPIDWYFFFLGGMLFGKGITLQPGSRLAKLTRSFIWVHLVALSIYGTLTISGLVTQQVTQVLAYCGLPALLMCGLTLHLTGYKIKRPD